MRLEHLAIAVATLCSAAIALGAAGELAAADSAEQLVTFRLDGSDDAWCASVSSTFAGPGGVPYAWLLVRATPAWVVRMPLDRLEQGCAR